jgi:predicted nuclease of predicted toxin-antitoxin system
MRVLLDNCVDQRFARLIRGHEVIHARKRGWSELQNGDLLAAAETDGFEVLITVDKQMQHQQTLRGRKITVLVLGSRRISLKHIAPLADAVTAALDRGLPEGEFITIVPP